MTTTPSREAQRARRAVAVMFLTNGALFANLIPRYPEIKAALELDNTAYGLTVIAFPIGAIVAGLGAAALIRRFGSAAIAAVGTVVTSVAILAAGSVPVWALLMVALFVAGALDAIVDVAQNAHGLRVQRQYKRSILNSFHAIWSIGAVLGGAMAAVAIALKLPIPVHLGISAVVLSLAAVIAYRFRLPGRDEASDEESIADVPEVTAAVRAGVPARTVWIMVALIAIAIAGTVVEDAGNSWATLYLSDSLSATAALAATGFIALVGAQFIGRLIGDRMVDRFGQRAVARTGGLIAALGMGLALAFPTVPGTIIGFAAAGFGVATLVPAAMQQADELPGLKHGTGLTVVSWLMRLGFLLSPPLVGLVADSVSLRAALLIVPVVGVVVILAAGVLPRRQRA